MRRLTTWAALLLASGCGATLADDDEGAAAPDGGIDGRPECLSSNECPTGWTCSEFFTCVPPGDQSDGGVPPAEVEYEFGDPVSSQRFVYVAMTELDSLAKIDGATLEVSSVAVGDQPEVLAAVPGGDAVVVLDRANATASVVRASGERSDTTTVATLPNLNRLSVDPTGSYAVAWFDLRRAVEDAGDIDGVGPIGSFQDVTVIRLGDGMETAVDLTVGFRPREVEFDEAGTRAYVVTDDGVSVIDLAGVVDGGPGIVSPLPVTADPHADPLDIEVNVSASGEHAIIRERGKSELRALELAGEEAGALHTVPLAAEPSDVDLAPDGSRAYAVLRDASALAIVDLPADLADPADVTTVDLGGEAIGSLVLSAAGDRGLLYTNAEAVERLTVVDLTGAGAEHTTYRLQKSVRAVGFDPSGAKAIVLHAKTFGDPNEPGIDFDTFIDRSHGYSVFDVATGFSKLQVTPVGPGAFAFAPDEPKGYVILDGGDAEGAIAETHVIELDTGVVRPVGLSSPPASIGVLPATGVVFVNQRHPLGRVSFFDVGTDAVRTVTGFDLNSRVVD